MSDETKKNNEWQERELGALWKKESTTQVLACMGYNRIYHEIIYHNSSKLSNQFDSR